MHLTWGVVDTDPGVDDVLAMFGSYMSCGNLQSSNI